MGTEEFWVPAALAALGTGASAYNASAANSRAQGQEVQGIEQQNALRQQAAGQVNKTIQQVAQSNPQALQAKATGDYINQLRTNAAATDPGLSGTSNTPGGSSRFKGDVSAANTSTANYGNDLASQLAATSSAVRQRQQEGLNMNTLQTNLGLIGAQSGQNSFLTQLRAAAAGQQNPWIGMGASLATNAGNFLSKNPQYFNSKTPTVGSFADNPSAYLNAVNSGGPGVETA